MLQVGVAAFDLRSASLHLSQYIETSCSYQNTKTLLHFYDPMIVIVSPNKTAADGMVGVSELVDKNYPSNKKVTSVYDISSIFYRRVKNITAF
jgi:DNA mismatch repair protein MSH4